MTVIRTPDIGYSKSATVVGFDVHVATVISAPHMSCSKCVTVAVFDNLVSRK